jgi:hypothetical protein
MTRLVPPPTNPETAAAATVLVQCWGAVFLKGGRGRRCLVLFAPMQVLPRRRASFGVPALHCTQASELRLG